MVIDPRAIGFELTEPIRQHVLSRMDGALRHFASRVLQVTVRLDDVNGDHGGEDKRCNVIATLSGRRVMKAVAIRRSLYSAVDAAAERIRGAVRRTLTKHVGRERKGSQRPGSLWQNNETWNAPARMGPADEGAEGSMSKRSRRY